MYFTVLNVIFVLFNIVCIFYTVKSYGQKTILGKKLARSILMTILLMWAYVLNFYIKSESVAAYLCCCEHIFISWILFMVVLFFIELIGKESKRNMRICSVGILLFDSVILLTNPINHFAGDFVLRESGEYSYTQIVPKPLFYVHVGVCLCMLVMMVISMVHALVESSKFYRLRYYIIISVVFVTFGLYAVFFIDKTAVVDYSRFFYGFAIILFYFATYQLSPYMLMKDLQKYVDENISDATIIYDNTGRILQMNDKAEKLFDASVVERREDLVKALSIAEEEIKGIRVIGNNVFEVLYKPVYDKKRKYAGAVFIFHDVTENRRQLEREHKAATIDSLTGIYNRLGFFEAAPVFMRNNEGNGGYAVMVSGIRDFKGINGLYGTKVGDKVLIEIASRFKEFHKRIPMVYARTAEGKFSCILPFEYLDEVANETSTIKISVEEGVDVNVGLCHGFVVMKDTAKSVETYYELSLLALARCKKKMTSPILEYSQDMALEQQRKQQLVSEMHRAVEERQFFIEIQPQVDLNQDKVCGAEALARWNHPTLGIISPMEFVPLFEDNGLITRVDLYIWEEAVRAIRTFMDNNSYDGPISVNVSQVDIMCLDVTEELLKILKKYDVSAKRLHVEITESACVNNRGVLIDTLNKLRENGFVVEIDDFGSGYSSLNALMHLPFDVVKLDMEFMNSTIRDKKCEVIVSAISKMIHDLNTSIVVEGVETLENVESAMYINGDAAQGYHYSKPLSLKDFEAFVARYPL